MKYDCNKTLDFSHEYKRLCHCYPDCEGCPVPAPCPDLGDVTAEHIAIVQKWSDEHGELPTLTPEEDIFVQSFKVTADKHIERRHGYLFLVMGYSSMELWPGMFPFIEEGETWFLDELQKLEVKEDD